MKKILLIDDDRFFLEFLTNYVRERYPGLEILAHDNALKGLAQINADLDLLLLDLEMPDLDGSKLLSYAPAMMPITCTSASRWVSAWRC
jgi:DNA-binding response OmpR family regulator